MNLRFQLVPFGASAPPAAVSCDGLVAGAALHLSHWAGNQTPERYRRDTSTESALAYAAEPDDAALEVVVNNHVDTDGILSCWALVRPDEAARHAPLLVAAAEAGDFEEWPDDDRGLWLDAAVRHLAEAAGDDTLAYPAVFAELDALCRDLEGRRALWQDEWQTLTAGLERVRTGAVSVAAHGKVTLFVHGRGEQELPGPVVFRHTPRGTTRLVLAFEQDDGTWEYRIERPRHAWAETVVRPRLPSPPAAALARLGDAWSTSGGALGMTGLARTTRPVREPPERLAERLGALDPGAA